MAIEITTYDSKFGSLLCDLNECLSRTYGDNFFGFHGWKDPINIGQVLGEEILGRDERIFFF